MGLYRVSNASVNTTVAVELTDDVLIVHTFSQENEPPQVGYVQGSYETIIQQARAHLIPGPNSPINNRYLPVPRQWCANVGPHEGNFLYTGSAIMSLRPEDTAYFGADEWTPFSLWELTTGGRGLVDLTVNGWRNRFNFTRGPKAPSAPRWRMLEMHSYIGVMYVPFPKASLKDHRIEIKSRLPIVCIGDTALTGEFQEIPGQYGSWSTHYWHVEPDGLMQVDREGGDVSFQLVWNNDTPCQETVEMEIETDAGYLPRRRITFDAQGKATINIIPVGLTEGETLKVKFSVGSYSGVSTIPVEVI